MKSPYEIHQEQERKRAAEELDSIIDKPDLSPQEIWEITPENFYAWRKKHDFPRILNHFSKKLTNFDIWKKEYKLSDDQIIALGISNCINPNPSKDKKKFIVESTWEGNVSQFVSYQNIDGKFYNLGPNLVNHKVISSFIGYVDWCNSKKINILKESRFNQILSNKTSSHPMGVPMANQITILGGLELLKIGGLEIKANAFNNTQTKYFEFVNADYLKLSGNITTGGRELIFQNSYVDNFLCDNLNLALVKFNNCNVNNLHFINSSLQQWEFYSCNVTGKAIDYDLRMISIYEGYFNIDFKDSTLDNVNARKVNETTYRTFKTVYANQGDDKKAIEYFLLEKAEERKRVRKQIFHIPHLGLFKPTKKEVVVGTFKNVYSNGLKFISLWVNNFYWGYGRKPLRVVRNSSILILIFSLIFYLGQSHMSLPNNQTTMSITDSLYFSTVTFTTLGYGDFAPLDFMRIVTAFEAFIGGISLGFLVAGFSNFKY